ncbi:MAG: DNA translocase FtsK 4TM domain-containing protein [Candidatus Buchananbacteria bacterium]|nr:DNA translocase FtsK 4TM domain-containing protein [Candidatus Buchananbacteria bacterium]
MARKKAKTNRVKGLRDLNIGRPNIEVSDETRRWIGIILLFVVGIISLLSLFDAAGTIGVYLNNFFKLLFGISRWYIPVLLIIMAYFMWRPAEHNFKNSNIVGAVLFILSFNGLIHIIFHQNDLIDAARYGLGGGYSGVLFSWLFLKFLGFWAGMILALALAVIGFILMFESYIVAALERRSSRVTEEDEEVAGLLSKIKNYFSERSYQKAQASRDRRQAEEDEAYEYPEDEEEVAEEDEEDEPSFFNRAVGVEKHGGKKNLSAGAAEDETDNSNDEEDQETKKDSAELTSGVRKFKQIPVDLPLSLLDGKTTTPKGGDLKANKIIIEKTLKNFGINVEMGEAQVGPTVTQYTLKPAEGVRLSKIAGLSDNLALALAAHPIRIEAPIPNKSLVGIEVPNQATAIVPLKDILVSDVFKARRSNLSIALGMDVMGKPWLAELEKMPHLLIAGATNSGKSVCINAVILSLLFQNGPGELKFIMVDPKRVELPIYNNIPHLLTPVITDTKKTVNALRWAIKEMEKRFDMLSAAHHRNIQSYNEAHEEKIPYIVIVIDEMADLMAASGPEVEAAIVRLAQMSRAVGIHLILATQRPSVDVLTGLIKANIPARVAFSVTSLVDSRTILDQSGAEKLLGKGDMLFVSAEMSKPKRLQGAFASDEEIKRITAHLKKQAEPDYMEEIIDKPQASFGDFSAGDGGDGGDPLLQEAKEIIFRAKKASASLLQRRLRVGYARAARILDLLEEQGVIGPGDGAKPREVLITSLEDDTIKDSYEEDETDEPYEEDEDFEEDEMEEDEDDQSDDRYK